MTRIIAALLLALLFPWPAAAQGARFPARLSANPAAPPEAQESVTISDPTGSTVTTTAASITVNGAVTVGLASEPVTWTNALTGGSGTVVLDISTRLFTTAVAASAVRFQDDVIRTTNANVTATTPTVGSWLALRTDNGNFCEARATDYIQPSVSDTLGTRIVACEMDPSTPITGGNYDVWFTLASGAWSLGSTSNTVLLFDIVDVTDGTKDYCSVELFSSTQNPDVRLTKTLNDVSSILTGGAATANVAPVNGQVWHLKVRGNVITLYQDDIERITATDADCHRASAARLGFAEGATYVGGTRTIATSSRVNFIRVEDADAGTSGILLNVGDNLITIEGCKAGGAPCYTAQIHVIRTGSDTTPPNLSTTSPSSGVDYPTDQTSIAFAGAADDPGGGISSVVVSCPTGTPTTPAVNIVNGVWSAATVTFAAGATHSCTITATDTASLTTVLTRNIIIAAAADTTDPTVTITSPTSTGSSSGTVSAVSLGGTATDNVALRVANPITWTSDTCGSGTVPSGGGGTSLNWLISPITQIGPTCAVIVTAWDAAGRSVTDTHTFTFDQLLSWLTSATLPTAGQSVAYTTTVRLQGGTGPYTIDNNAGGTALGCTPTIGAAGAVTDLGNGTATVTGTFPTVGTCTFTLRGQAAAGGPTTQVFSLTVVSSVIPGTDDSYFNSLIGRSDLFRQASLRSLAQLNSYTSNNASTATCPITPDKVWSYDPSNDANPNRYDAARMVICSFADNGATLSTAMAASTAGGYESINADASNAANGRVYYIDGELVICASPTAGQACKIDALHFWGLRGSYSTTAAAHAIGTPIYPNATKLTQQLNVPINNDPTEAATYLITWDMRFSRGWGGMGVAGNCDGIPAAALPLANAYACSTFSNGFKAFQNRAPSISNEWKISNYLNASLTPTGYDLSSDVGIFNLRMYNPMDPTYIYTNDEPVQPPTSKEFRLLPDETIRVWEIIEWNPDGNTAAFQNLTTLTQPMDDVTTTVTFDATGWYTTFNALYDTSSASVGRRLKVGSEIMYMSSCTISGTPRTCTVIRGYDGTTAAAHSAGDALQVQWNCLSFWAASESQPAVLLLDDVRYAPRRNGTTHAMEGITFWNLEFDDSASRLLQNRVNIFPNNMTAYIENLAVLKISGTNNNTCGGIPAAWSGLFTQP